MKGKWEKSGTRIVQYSMVLNLPSILEVAEHMFILYGKRRYLLSNDISNDIESMGQALDNLIFAIHSSLLL